MAVNSSASIKHLGPEEVNTWFTSLPDDTLLENKMNFIGKSYIQFLGKHFMLL